MAFKIKVFNIVRKTKTIYLFPLTLKSYYKFIHELKMWEKLLAKKNSGKQIYTILFRLLLYNSKKNMGDNYYRL